MNPGWYFPKKLILLIDITLTFLSLILAYLIRFDFIDFYDLFWIKEYDSVLTGVPSLILIRYLTFLIGKTHKSIIRHFSNDDALRIFYTISIGTIIISSISIIKFKTLLPKQQVIDFKKQSPTLIYNFYNLDPNWKKDIVANRILLLEPSIFSKYPISQKTIEFVLAISQENIPNIQVFVGEFHELQNKYHHQKIIFKEHPLNYNYKGIQEARDWMFDVKGYHSSFFSFWKKCKKEMVLLIK